MVGGVGIFRCVELRGCVELREGVELRGGVEFEWGVDEQRTVEPKGRVTAIVGVLGIIRRSIKNARLGLIVRALIGPVVLVSTLGR